MKWIRCHDCLKTLLLVGIFMVQWGNDVVDAEKTSETVKVDKEQRFADGFRKVPWCINGNDEPEFQKYPNLEFKPFLQKADTYNPPKLQQYKYEVQLKNVKLKGHDEFASGGNLYNTAHLIFKATERQTFEQSVGLHFNPSELEGLIIQANYAPYGVGLPTLTFLEPEDLVCSDCEKPLGRPVACRKKTWLNLMHPTVLVFHHKMLVTNEENERDRTIGMNRNYQKFCVSADGRKVDDNGTIVGQNVVPNSSEAPAGNSSTPATPVAKSCWADDECPPAQDTEPCTPSPERCNSSITPCPPEELEPAVLCPAGKCRIPTPGKFCASADATAPLKECKTDEDCKESSSEEEEEESAIKCEEEELQTINGEPYEFTPKKYLGKSAEIHGNFVWYTHPCHLTRVVRFLFLIVHSFSKGKYHVLQSQHIYELPDIPLGDNPLYVPSPIFSGFEHLCDNTIAQVPFKEVYNDTGVVDFDFSKSYDQCIQSTISSSDPDPLDPVCHDCPATNIGKAHKVPARCTTGKTRYSMDDEYLYLTKRRCAQQCPTLPTSTTVITTTTPQPLIKRSFHGGINFVTNFCIMPITIFIARFYKETFNLSDYKGVKLWYWMHLFGSGGSAVLMYAGYFSRHYVQDSNPHVWIGNIYIIVLAIAYASSWMRHKNSKITALAEIIHGVSGYSCMILALACMHTVPDLSHEVFIVVYTSCALLLLFYIGMTFHICTMDKMFGMRPMRRHFPTVEAKFDDIPVPGSLGRKICLVILTLIVLVLCLCTLFF